MKIENEKTWSFKETLVNHNISVSRNEISILQLNIGKVCNQACVHCHVDAGPHRTEVMSRETMDRILLLLRESKGIHTVDITGGAPELNPDFRYLVTQLIKMKKRIIDRCNLSVLSEDGQEDTAEFLAQNKVEIVASLPCYLESNVDNQRGKLVYQKSIQALQKLNSLGYGMPGSGLTLNLVYNPGGAHLPPGQANLQQAYKQFLKENFGIEFNSLLALTNMPIKRFASLLKKEGHFESYSNLLKENFNPQAAAKIMCRELLSVGWDGQLYDCDFNQALDAPLSSGPNNVMVLKSFEELEMDILFKNHCYGCTAGSGSSCGGTLI